MIMASTTRPMLPTCRWIPDEDGVFDTECGHRFEFANDGPVENGATYCCYCGRVLKARAITHAEDRS